LRTLSRTATLRRIVRETGINYQYLSRIFNGKGTPSLRTATKIATYLRVTVDALIQAISLQDSSFVLATHREPSSNGVPGRLCRVMKTGIGRL
jgi:transcriptional regulator with XRE-family HTH domain